MKSNTEDFKSQIAQSNLAQSNLVVNTNININYSVQFLELPGLVLESP
jgi:hypothetical protein